MSTKRRIRFKRPKIQQWQRSYFYTINEVQYSTVQYSTDQYLVCQGAQGRGRLCPGGGVLRQAEVLGHQGGPEASLVVVTAGDVREDPGAWIVGVDRPTSSCCRAHDVGQQLRLQAQPEGEIFL